MASNSPQDDAPRYRSGAVARMVRMPVTTLRVWERRYHLSQAALTPSGQRLYSAADVQRLALIKQLSDLGHAIGALARLDMAALQAVQATHAQTVGGRHVAEAAPGWRLAVIGDALHRRLQRDPCWPLGRPRPTLTGPWPDLATAAQAAEPADAVVWYRPGLQPDDAEHWAAHAAALARLGAPGVVYDWASSAALAPWHAQGVPVLRETVDDAALGRWVCGLRPAAPSEAPPQAEALSEAAPRRWDDAALVELAGLSTTMACECPRHIAELLRQLAHFEAYSRDCTHRSPEDAALHAHLTQVAAQSRAWFEDALARVVAHEGLLGPR